MLENKSISEIILLIKSKEVLVKEVIEFYLEKINNHNPSLNAIVLQKEEEVILEEAIAKDKQSKDKIKPLFGLPLACNES